MRLVTTLILTVGVLAGPASGQQILYAVGSGDSDQSANLLQIVSYDNALVSVVDLGELGLQFGDIAIDPVTGKIYATDFTFPGTNLYEISLINGPVLIGPTSGLFINALEFDTAGTLYGWGDQNFVTIDVGTGAATLVGTTGLTSGGDLACDLDGTMYGCSNDGRLARIDVQTGQSTTIGSHGGGVTLFGLEVDLDGKMYGVRDGGVATDSEIYTVDKQTGQATSIAVIPGSAGLGTWGVSFTQQCGFTAYGDGVAPAQTMSMTWRIGAPPNDQNGTFVLAGGTPNGVALLLVALGPGSTPVDNNTVLVDLSPGQFFTTALPLAPNGVLAFPLSAGNAALSGVPFYVQAIDAAVPSSSNGLRMQFCP